MRALVLLLLAASVFADDRFLLQAKIFEEARATTLEPGAQAKIYPALEDLVRTGDARAVKLLAAYLVDTLTLEKQLYLENRELQAKGAEVHERLGVLEKELNHLRLKEKAGDRSVGPQIQKRLREQAQKRLRI